MNYDFPIIIIGAGPAGASASLHLSALGIEHAIVDKAAFPRDKICGDALSGKVTSILKKLDPKHIEFLSKSAAYTASWGVIFSSPEGEEIAVPFKHKPKPGDPSPGYIAKRVDFDNYLYSHLDTPYCTVIEDKVVDVNIIDTHCEIKLKTSAISSQFAISAEGINGILARKYLGHKLEKDHYCAGIRAYYSGVENLSPEGYIELHFVKESLPGYFWIFPLPNGQANVGIGMLSRYVSKKKVDLKLVLEEVIKSDKFKQRFANAELVDGMKGWGLPLGSKKRNIQGHRFLLTGDAASLIDPFTGEGIGNAMKSGELAAKAIQEAIQEGILDTEKVKTYESKVYNKLWGELRLSRVMQKLIRYPWLFNWMIRKIKTNKELKKTVTFMFEDIDLRKKFSQPSFYLKVLFNRS